MKLGKNIIYQLCFGSDKFKFEEIAKCVIWGINTSYSCFSDKEVVGGILKITMT